MKNKKIIIIISAIIALALIIGGALWLTSGREITQEPNEDTPEIKIEAALEDISGDSLYDLLYSYGEDEPTKSDFNEAIKAATLFFDFGSDVTVTYEKGEYIATDSKGSKLGFTPKDNGKYEMSVISTSTAAYTVYAPEGSAVTLDGEEMKYNESGKNYYIFGISKGKHLLKIEKEGCITHEAYVDTDENNSSVSINLDYNEEYLKEYEQQATDTLRKLLRQCAEENSDLSSYSFKSDTHKLSAQNLIDGIVRDLAPYEADFGKIKIGNIRFAGFGGEKIARYDENSGNCTAELQYEYSYEVPNNDGTVGLKSRTGEAMLVMEKLDGVWYLESVFFTLHNF